MKHRIAALVAALGLAAVAIQAAAAPLAAQQERDIDASVTEWLAVTYLLEAASTTSRRDDDVHHWVTIGASLFAIRFCKCANAASRAVRTAGSVD